MMATVPRGLRNNNPGNIRITNIPWRGKLPGGDGTFEVFVDRAHGYRALMRNLRTFMRRDNLRTVYDLIKKWAPPSENNTAGYVRRVCKKTGYSAHQILKDDKETLTALAAAICLVENEVPAVPEEIEAGWKIMY